MRFTLSAACALAMSSAALADMTNFRDWVDANSFATNSTSNLWYGTTGLGGPLMAPGTSWISAGQPFSTPLIGPLVSPGSEPGAAGPATFDGSWVHPGNGIPAVLTFAPQAPTLVGAVHVHTELIANGLSGNGITIQVLTTIGGVTTNHGQTFLGGTVSDQVDEFNLPAPTVLSPGDTVAILFGDNGSYLYDHVNFNAWMSPIPAPGSVALLGAGLVVAARRRR
ncbi:MAG TPA: PEP-CTERM sorting domain-containing protein [Phycisphaerales bacterium]|nr:PEP-CTERM sorting domain-containing protein [Phycisphaerales bacterium]